MVKSGKLEHSFYNCLSTPNSNRKSCNLQQDIQLARSMYLFATDMAESYAICYVYHVPKSHFEAFFTEMFCLQETVCSNHKQNTLYIH